jgi:hypothetical protein
MAISIAVVVFVAIEATGAAAGAGLCAAIGWLVLARAVRRDRDAYFR